MRLVASVLMAAAMVSSAGLPAQTYVVRQVASGTAKGLSDVHISKAALPGREIRVWWATLLNPDCSPAGTMETEIVTAPRHGKLELSDDPFFPNYTDPNPRVACDTKKTPGKQAFYTSDPDFHGHDRIVLQNATSEGRMRRVTIDVAVE